MMELFIPSIVSILSCNMESHTIQLSLIFQFVFRNATNQT